MIDPGLQMVILAVEEVQLKGIISYTPIGPFCMLWTKCCDLT